MQKLEEMGQLDNTFVFFTADHGIAVGRHGLTGKQNLYEHTWRVPFLVRGPDQINLANDPRHSARLRDLEALLLSEQKKLDDPFRLWDQPQR